MGTITLKGQIIKEWLTKWPDLPSLQLARMIYNSDNNHLLFKNIENIRTTIRFYKMANGKRNRSLITDKTFAKPLKNLTNVQPSEEL